MHHPTKRQNMHSSRSRPNNIRGIFLFWLLVMMSVLVFQGIALAQSPTNPSGLPLPRFATTRSQPINVRVGPGTRYEVAWVYVKAGIPIEIIQEFDTWRKVRDFEGEEGWIHQNLLSGRRAGRVSMASPSRQIALRVKRSDQANVRAWLGPDYPVEIEQCDGEWCAVRAKFSSEKGKQKSYAGFLPQITLWGVYPNEIFD